MNVRERLQVRRVRGTAVAAATFLLGGCGAPARDTQGWRVLAESDSVVVSLDTSDVRMVATGGPRDTTIVVRLRYDFHKPQGRSLAAALRLRRLADLPRNLRIRRADTREYADCRPGRRSSFVFGAALIDAVGDTVVRDVIDTRDPRGFPSISGSAGPSLCSWLDARRRAPGVGATGAR